MADVDASRLTVCNASTATRVNRSAREPVIEIPVAEMTAVLADEEEEEVTA